MLQKIQRPSSDSTEKTKGSTPSSCPGSVKDTKQEAGTQPKMEIRKTGALVIDVGSSTCKVGFAGDLMPQSLLGSMVGYPTGKNKLDEIAIGKPVFAAPNYKLVEPTRHGIIVDWEAAEDLLGYAFYKDLKVSPEEHAVLISDPPLSPTTNREKIAEFLFERFNVPAMNITYQSVLTVYSYGKTTGLVVDSGHGVTHAVPVDDGYNLPAAISRMDLGGHDLTTYLMDLLAEAGNTFQENSRYIVEDIKQKCCYVVVDQEKEAQLPDQEYLVDYELPDGHVITIGKERRKCTEALFKPSLMGSDEVGIHLLTINSLNRLEPRVQRLMFDNVLLSGGSTMFEGFYSRFCREMLALAPKDAKANIHAIPERKFAVWVGGSILASLHAFQSLWIRREDYQEQGPHIVYQRCY
ncbi:uncharacterized protein [Hemitrygon akajei]|uniref:uncharacterized protein n=1 Tax=Hemitrygon akajei TaxID=2704970 RepID=UPI003BF98F5F